MDVAKLGWDTRALGEVDHRRVKAPYVRLVSATVGVHGDVVYFYDLRITQPNTSYLSTTGLHSMEHLLLAGFRRYLPDNFINIAPMGCQTGIYLVLLNEGRAEKVLGVYETILKDILEATSVPYADIQDCGHWEDHDLELAKAVARKVLDQRARWLQAL
ncbi:MAG TPA: S-ribosylhomocysteine lyase [Anaerolineales bacterium]